MTIRKDDYKVVGNSLPELDRELNAIFQRLHLRIVDIETKVDAYLDDPTSFIAGESGHITVTDDGDATVTIGLEDVWDDLRFPVSAIKLGTVNPPQPVSYKSGLIYAFEDEAVNEDIVHFVAQLPHSYKQGSDVEVHVHWVPEDNTAGVVRWAFTYSWANIGSTFPAASSLTANATCPQETDHHEMTSLGEMDGDGKTISSIIICSLYRNSTNAADTYTNKDARLLEIDFHFEKDTLGSATDSAK